MKVLTLYAKSSQYLSLFVGVTFTLPPLGPSTGTSVRVTWRNWVFTVTYPEILAWRSLRVVVGLLLYIFLTLSAHMLLHAHSSSDHSLTTVGCVCGPQVLPLHAAGLASRVTAKRSQNQFGPSCSLRSCTVRAVESLWPFTSSGTNHIYWAALELE